MIWIGTSGYNYPEWKGSFYPPTLSSSKMLSFYAQHFVTVEINYTFYRLPNAKTIAAWASGTPETFRFTLKAPRRITHDARLEDCQALVDVFCRAAAGLGSKLGVLLFQLPPYLRRDVARLDTFLGWLPSGLAAAFEFRHPSWHDEEVFALLRNRNLALCIADAGRLSTPLVSTADYGYFRLRDEGYQPADFDRWARTIGGLLPGWKDVYVYFKHEEEGTGPAFAKALMASLDALT